MKPDEPSLLYVTRGLTLSFGKQNQRTAARLADRNYANWTGGTFAPTRPRDSMPGRFAIISALLELASKVHRGEGKSRDERRSARRAEGRREAGAREVGIDNKGLNDAIIVCTREDAAEL